MGWCSGSHVAEEVWLLVRPYIPEDKRQEVARKILDKFSDHDADCWDDVHHLPEDSGYNEEMRKQWEECGDE